ncbi:PolC-type DNA polymerase III [Desulforamulus ruminis]|uniref:3'-5' exonuclease n=1 Tax=Desulforamulus ruminis TaxID=1564 RepID=UPI0023536B0F|nr:3'-5' exonuclease [Desulforamulus ruminis]
MVAVSLLFQYIRSLSRGTAVERVSPQRTGGRFGAWDPEVPLREQRFLILDCETTGLMHWNGDRIMSLAAVRLEKGEINPEYFNTLVNPQRDVPSLAADITGLSGPMLLEQPLLQEVLPEFLDFAQGGIITGFNVGFDLAFLNAELQDHGREPFCAAHSLDVFVLARLLYPNCRQRSLEDLAQDYGVPVEGRHTAFGDAVMAARLLQAMLAHLEQKRVHTLQDLADFLSYCRLF